MVKDDVEVLFVQMVESLWILDFQIRKKHVPLTHQIDQDVSQAEEIVSVNIFTVPVIEIEIDPPVNAAFMIDEDMIPPNVAVFFTIIMKEADGFYACQERIQHSREVLVKKNIMGAVQFFNRGGEGFAVDEVDDADRVSGLIGRGVTVHEIGVGTHQA